MTWKDPARRKEYMRLWHKAHPGRLKARRYKLRDFVNAFKAACADCGYDECKQALHFHHLSDKDFPISQAIEDGWGKERLLAEIAKCVVICGNCHAKRHCTNGCQHQVL